MCTTPLSVTKCATGRHECAATHDEGLRTKTAADEPCCFLLATAPAKQTVYMPMCFVNMHTSIKAGAIQLATWLFCA